MKTIYFLAIWLISAPLMAMNIGGGLYRFEFEVLLVIFVTTMLVIGHFPEIKDWLVLKYQYYLNKKNQSQEQ